MDDLEELPFKVKWFQVIIYGAITSSFLLLAIWGFTQPAFIESFNLSNKGTIGDAIGGITSPIINLLGAFLVYISFRAQYSANILQYKANLSVQKEWEYDTLVKIFSDIQSETNNLRYTEVDNGIRSFGTGMVRDHEGTIVTYQGSEAISKFINNIQIELENRIIGFMSDISFIMEDLNALISDTESSKITNERKSFLLNRINRFYITKFQSQLILISNALEVKKREALRDNEAYYFNYYESVLKSIEVKIEHVRNTLPTMRSE